MVPEPHLDDVLRPPALRFFAELSVEVTPAIEVGATPSGQRRLIPIVGGTVTGDGWAGVVVPGGADFQRIVTPRLAELDARYVLETTEGERLFVQNRALRVADPADTQRLIRGEPVDPARIYFRCQPLIETAAERFAWVNERVFVGTGMRLPDRVVMRFYVVA